MYDTAIPTANAVCCSYQGNSCHTHNLNNIDHSHIRLENKNAILTSTHIFGKFKSYVNLSSLLKILSNNERKYIYIKIFVGY